MTAYVNDEQKKEGAYGKAVKATLAATLAAGMVPAAAAFADDAQAETSDGNDVEVLAVSPENAFKAGRVTAAEDNEGNAIADLAKVSFVADGKAHYVVPTEFTPAESDAVDVTDNAKYTFEYYALDEDGQKKGLALTASDIKNPGSYGVVVKTANGSMESDVAATFTITSASLEDATLFEGDDIEDTEFVYTGQKLNLKLALNGEEVESAKYEMKFYPKGSGAEVANWNAGEYVAVVKGKDLYDGQEVKIPFTIAKLDVAKAVVDLGSFDGAALNTDVSGVKVDGVADVVEAKVTSVPSDIYNDPKGVYKVTVTAKSDNATGTQVVEYVKTTEKTAVIKYDGNDLKSEYTTDYSAEKPEVFDVKKLAAYKDADVIKDAKVNIVVRENNENGDIVKNADLTKPGTWHVTVSLDPASVDYTNASANEQTFTVKVVDGSVDEAADVFVKYDGAVVDGMAGDKALTYTGEDLFKNVSVVVNSGDKTLVEGKDYEIALTKEVDGDDVAVDTMVDAGTYTLTISSVNYDFTDTVEFEVKPIEVTAVRFDPAMLLLPGTSMNLASYTGEPIALAFQYESEELDAEGKKIWKELPADTYELKIKVDGKAVEEVKDIAKYTVELTDNADDVNYDVKKASLILDVTDERVFSDVPNTEWYFEYVLAASQAGYMKGIGDSDIFAPNQTTTRAMAATVLYRMVGAATTDDLSESFSDVDRFDWFVNEVAWAASTGIVSGYPGTDEFRPNNNVTRAEFCVMMQRYAAATNQGVALEAGEADSILAEYDDGAAVPAWCKDAVAWAVKNEVFGGYSVLNPDGDITRAEMAKMAVALQAEPLK